MTITTKTSISVIVISIELQLNRSNPCSLNVMSLLSVLFPASRPRRRRTALFGGFSVLGMVGVFLMRSCSGKSAGFSCASSNDCSRNLICAEALEETAKGKKRADGIKLCADTCLSDASCATGLNCQEVREHTVGPRGGAHENKARACLVKDP
jgi:hypothetical protein